METNGLEKYLLAVALFGAVFLPGALTIRRPLRSEIETLCEIILRALTTAGTTVLVCFAFGLPLRVGLSFLFLLSVFSLILRRKLLVQLFQEKEVRCALLAFSLLVLWILTGVSAIPSYSGGGWYWDWFEHYERAKLLADQGPITKSFGNISFAARPALGNAIVAVPLILFGTSYIVFS